MVQYHHALPTKNQQLSLHLFSGTLPESHPSYQERNGGLRKPPTDDDKAEAKH